MTADRDPDSTDERQPDPPTEMPSDDSTADESPFREPSGEEIGEAGDQLPRPRTERDLED
jgi:hypothetical protein